MKLGRCPLCHAHIELAAVAEDDAARELLALVATLDAPLGRALIAYLALWRPAKHDLRWDRALRLARETLALDEDSARLAAALSDTVEGLRAKAGTLPLRSHGYLRRVLASVKASAAQAEDGAASAPARSRTAEAMRRLVEGA